MEESIAVSTQCWKGNAHIGTEITHMFSLIHKDLLKPKHQFEK